MIKNLLCIDCNAPTAKLTQEENRVYKILCSCGYSTVFEHVSEFEAEKYYKTLLDLDFKNLWIAKVTNTKSCVCCKKKYCDIKPITGQLQRINCYLWEGESK